MGDKRHLYVEDGVDEPQAGFLDKAAPLTTLHAPTPFFAVANGATVTIPFVIVLDSSPEIDVASGVLTPQRRGWYHVYAYVNDSYPGGAYTYNLHILGNGSIGIVDFHVGNRPFRMSGSQVVYCDGVDDTIEAAISHNAAGTLTFNHNVGYVHKSYIVAHWIGDELSGEIE